jgi:formyl-CoA transferase
MDLFRNLTVLSLEQATVLPYLTYRLAQDGMKVVKLEHPKFGDPNRLVGDNVLGEEKMNAYILCINAGKKAMTLNLGEAKGRAVFQSLIHDLDVDIFATNQLPKNYEKLGIDYDTLKRIKSDIIWLGVTGFGPESNEAAYDPILQARSGLMDLTGKPDDDPFVLGVPLPDMGTSEHAYGLLMRALFTRQLTGEGTCIHLAMFESSVSWLTVPITLSTTFGKHMTRRGNTHEFFCPVSVYEARDGYVYIAVGNDRQWKSLVSLDIFQSLDQTRYKKNAGRIQEKDHLNRLIENITRNQTAEVLIKALNEVKIPISKIYNVNDVVKDPHIVAKLLSSVDPVTGMTLTLAPPPRMTSYLEQSQGQLSFPPRFGEHNEEIYGGTLGYSDQEIQQLKREGVI